MNGTWKLSFSTPMGTAETTFNLTNNDGNLSGSCNSSGPAGEINTDASGSYTGNDFELKTTVEAPGAGPIELTFSGTIDGDSCSGNVQLGAFGSAAFTGESS